MFREPANGKIAKRKGKEKMEELRNDVVVELEMKPGEGRPFKLEMVGSSPAEAIVAIG